jgi:WhiB family redox-sensing transcriptional regulator
MPGGLCSSCNVVGEAVATSETRQRVVAIWESAHPLDGRPEHLQPGRGWRRFALCLGHPSDLWYPVGSDGGAEAIAICSVCPVRLDCLRWAVEHREREGIWGGISAKRRKQMRPAHVALTARSLSPSSLSESERW